MYLHTQRLLIRNFSMSDLESFLAYRNDPEVAKYQSWSVPYAREKGEDLIREMCDLHAPKQGDWLQLALELKETGAHIGDVVFGVKQDDIRQCSIGFTIASDYQKNGYATEAVTALLDYLFEDVDMHRVIADCDTENVGSWKTLEKIGFRREAHYVESFLQSGEYRSEYFYGMLQREWRAKAAFRNC